jgi:uncharacterized membrane protein YeaQ/YmgE (transglycosylase-associated protein family)
VTLEQFDANKIYFILAFVGLVAGWLSGKLIGGGGLIRNLIVGVLGAFVGGMLVNLKLLKLPFEVPFPLGHEILVATIGAILVTLFARILAR